MPGRHTYWVIVAGTNPTAFRARHPEDLLPTLKQLQRTQPDAVLKWFERSRLWESPEQALADFRRPRTKPTRGAGWRPGGSHVDPRARFKVPRDEKRRRFKKRLQRQGSQRTEDKRPNNRRREK